MDVVKAYVDLGHGRELVEFPVYKKRGVWVAHNRYGKQRDRLKVITHAPTGRRITIVHRQDVARVLASLATLPSDVDPDDQRVTDIARQFYYARK